MGDWKTITVPVLSSDSKNIFQYTSERKRSPTSMNSQVLRLPLPSSKNMHSFFSAFCTEENIEQSISYIDRELTTLGFPSIYSESRGKELNLISIINCMNELLTLQHKNLRAQEEVEMQHLKLGSDMEHLQNCYAKLKLDSLDIQLRSLVIRIAQKLLSNQKLLSFILSQDKHMHKEQLEFSKRQIVGLQERDRQLQSKNRNLHQLLKNEKDEVHKLQNIISSRATQYNHDIKRKEREYNKLKERLHQLVMNKKDKKIAMEVLNYVGRADGKRGAWRTIKTEARNEEEMYKVLLSDYEQRQKQLLMENAELKKVLQQMKKEIISLLPPQKQKPKERSEDGLVLSDVEEDTGELNKENMWELSCETVREQLTNSIRKQWRMLKNHVEKLDNQVSCGHSGAWNENDVISREDHELETEKLELEIQQCKEMIKTQQQLLQQQLTCDDDTTLLLQDCYLLEEKERLKEEWRLFREQKKNFEKERKSFTEAAIRLGLERKAFEEDRGAWLKQQFLSMTADYKQSENVTSSNAFLKSSDRDNRLVKSASQQRKSPSVLSGPVSSEPCQISQYITHNSVASKKTAEDSMPNQWVESDDKEETEECTKSWEDSGVGTLCRNLHMEQLPWTS